MPSTPRPPRALITGITGQDGSYLAEFLLQAGYEVHGVIRRASNFNTTRIDHLYRDPHERGVKLFLHFGDLADAGAMGNLLRQVKPDEVYNLAAQSHVRVSFDLPVYTTDIVAMGTIRLLEALRDYEQIESPERRVRFYQASSSEMFGLATEFPQTESTPFRPRSPYATAKLFAHWAAINYRDSYNMHCSCGIQFNHESPRRGETFVTRKITRAVGRIKLGMQSKLYLGNLDARRDWGYAGDYVRAMWLMLQQDQPDDYVIATGRMVSVRDFCTLAFAYANLDWRDFVEVDPRYFRPAEVHQLQGDSAKAKRVLKWVPTTSIEDLVQMMVESDLELARREKTLRDAGHDLTPQRGHDH